MLVRANEQAHHLDRRRKYAFHHAQHIIILVSRKQNFTTSFCADDITGAALQAKHSVADNKTREQLVAED
jgi:hypothetical protein